MRTRNLNFFRVPISSVSHWLWLFINHSVIFCWKKKLFYFLIKDKELNLMSQGPKVRLFFAYSSGVKNLTITNTHSRYVVSFGPWKLWGTASVHLCLNDENICIDIMRLWVCCTIYEFTSVVNEHFLRNTRNIFVYCMHNIKKNLKIKLEYFLS